jgi:glycolate oxidase iron-sulfur subunit
MMSKKIPLESLDAALLRDADLCVKCGLCLPHCPTYGVARDEAESPRGRIALMQGLANGTLIASAALEVHLDRCLACRACEVVCPAGVPYGSLIDRARERLAAEHPARARSARILAAVLGNRALRFLAALLLWLYQRLGMQRLARASGALGRGRLARMESALPKVYLPRQPRPSPYPLPGGEGGTNKVALFTNCTSPLVEPETLDGAVTLLARLGCDVSVPAAQGCCGALHQHAGLAAAARDCAGRNVAAFAQAETVASVASGCTAELLESATRADGGRDFAARVRDIHGFIADHPGSAQLRFRPLAARVLLHTPCTLRNAVKGDAAVSALLSRVPQLDVVPMDSACCGAAGSYFLTQPAMADALAQPKVEQVAAQRPAFVLSSNVGCALHLAAALRRAGVTIPVLAPVALLARQLAD